MPKKWKTEAEVEALRKVVNAANRQHHAPVQEASVVTSMATDYTLQILATMSESRNWKNILHSLVCWRSYGWPTVLLVLVLLFIRKRRAQVQHWKKLMERKRTIISCFILILIFLWFLGNLADNASVWPTPDQEPEALEEDSLIRIWDATSVDILDIFTGTVQKWEMVAEISVILGMGKCFRQLS